VFSSVSTAYECISFEVSGFTKDGYFGSALPVLLSHVDIDTR